MFLGFNSYGSHILGGEIFYDHVNGNTYQFTLILYLECGGVDETSALITAVPKNGGNNVSATFPRQSVGFVDDTYILNPCLSPPSSSCVRKAVFVGNLNLAPGTGGWDVYYEQFARSAALANITSPDLYSSIYFCEVPDPTDPNVLVPNNSPRFNFDPPTSLCVDDFFNYNHSAIDPDGDLVTYTLCDPKGNLQASVGNGPPYPNVPFCCGYTANDPMAATVPIAIDPNTGNLSGEPNTLGKWVFSICYVEERNGQVISTGTRDYVFSVTNCSPVVPNPQVVAQSTATTSGFCGNLTVEFNNASSNALVYFWDFGDPDTLGDTSRLENPTWQYDTAGVYDVMLVANPGSACADTVYSTFQVYPGTDAKFTAPGPQCDNGHSFDFAVTDYNEGEEVEWDFGAGTPSISNDTTPTGVTFPGPGTYPVTLTVTNPTCTTSVTKDVTILASAIPFYNRPDPQCIDNNSFGFLGNGANGPGSSYNWDFGPNAIPASSSNQNAVGVRFNSTGWQKVTLYITDASGCVGEYIDSVLVTNPPAPSFAPTDTQCQNISKYVFTNTGTYGPTATFSWNFGNQGLPNSASTESVDSVHFASSGNHVVTLSVTEYGCTETYQDTIYVADAPFAFIYPENNQCFLNQDFDLEGGGIYGPGAKFLWVLGPNASVDSVTTLNVNDVTFDTTGTFNLQFEVQESGCTDVFIVPVSVTDKPTAGFPAVGNKCLSDGPFDFINSGTFGPDATFAWDFDANATPLTATTRDVLGVNWSAPGTYDVCLTVSENGCDTTYCETIELTPAPSASYSPVVPQCVNNNSYDFTNTGTYGGTAVYNWYFEGSATPTSNLENPTGITFNNVGLNEVRLEITENNCTDVYRDSVLITAEPTPFYSVPAVQCEDNNSFSFNAGGGYGNNASFKWDFGPDANIDSTFTQNPTGISFGSAGMHPVQLTISENGCSRTYIDSVEVSPRPVPFYQDPAKGCVSSNSYSFNSAGTNGNNATYTWDFGTNAIPAQSSASNPSGVVFNTVGNHLVQLSVSENGCTYTYTDTVFITAAPVASTPAQADQCVSINSFDFMGQGSYGPDATFAWDFGPDATPNTSSNLDEIGVSFNTVGSHNITFSITENGCTDTYPLTVNITAAPGSDFQPHAPQCISGNSFNFQTLGLYGTGATFNWDFGPNANQASSVQENPNNISFNTLGWHTVSLTVTENGCPSTYVDSVEITASPVASFVQQPNICVNAGGLDFVQNGSSGSNASYSWDFGSSASQPTSTDANPTNIDFTTVGSHPVTLTITENGCTDTYTQNINVTASPIANYVRPIVQCESNNSFNIAAAGTFGSDATFDWDFGPMATPSTSTNQNVNGVSYQAGGDYPVTLTITENGCTHTYVDTFKVVPEPVAAFSANQTGCVPFTVSFNNQSSAANDVTYLWTFGDGTTSTDVNPVKVYDFPGTFNVSLEVISAEGCIGTYELVEPNFIEAFPTPTAGLDVIPSDVINIFDPAIEIVDLSYGGNSQDVFFSNGLPIGTLPTTFVFQDTGTYVLNQIVRNSDGCTDTLQRTIRVDPQFQFFAPSAFSPNEDNVNDEYLQGGYGIKTYQLSIYTRWGELIFTSDDIKEGWNGIDTKTGEKAQQDTYIYRTDIVDSFGVTHTFRGEVVLFR